MSPISLSRLAHYDYLRRNRRILSENIETGKY